MLGRKLLPCWQVEEVQRCQKLHNRKKTDTLLLHDKSLSLLEHWENMTT